MFDFVTKVEHVQLFDFVESGAKVQFFVEITFDKVECMSTLAAKQSSIPHVPL